MNTSAGHEHLIGMLQTIETSKATVQLEVAALQAARSTGDASLSNAGTVGSLVKMHVGRLSLFATVHDIRLAEPGAALATADLEFLGEGLRTDNGLLKGVRRGVSRYPYTCGRVYAV